MLLNNYTTPCVLLEKTVIADGYGGYTTVWREGITFDATIVLNNSLEAQTAMKQGVTGVYTISIPSALRLSYHDVFKRKSDGAIFRVTSKDDNATPDTATIRVRILSAESWELPSND